MPQDIQALIIYFLMYTSRHVSVSYILPQLPVGYIPGVGLRMDILINDALYVPQALPVASSSRDFGLMFNALIISLELETG